MAPGTGHTNMQMRGTSIHVLIGFLIFSTYFICKIGTGVRKVSSHGFEIRPGYLITQITVIAIIISLVCAFTWEILFAPVNNYGIDNNL